MAEAIVVMKILGAVVCAFFAVLWVIVACEKRRLVDQAGWWVLALNATGAFWVLLLGAV